MAQVALEGVSKLYPGGTAAVSQLDLRVEDREFLVLVGPSGCGKSTTLRMIAGLEEVSQGVVRIADRVVNDVPPKDRDIAMVFQNYALYPHMTVYKNMAFGLELRYGGGWLRRILRRVFRPQQARELFVHRQEIPGQVRQAARLLDIEHLLDRMPRQLSGGERQRVALGRAIVRQPAAFLFDEPLSNLDARLRVQMRRELKDLHRRLAATMVYVTHDQVEALTLGDRIAVMDRGRLQQVGPPMELYDMPANRFVAGFLGSPPMNFLEVRLEAAERGCRLSSRRLEVKWPELPAGWERFLNRDLVLGVRPEDVVVLDEANPKAGPSLRGTVSGVESLGDATIVYLKTPVVDGRLETGWGYAGNSANSADGFAPNGGEENNSVIALTSKTESRAPRRVGDVVHFVFRTNRAHWFDPRTGENLGLRER